MVWMGITRACFADNIFLKSGKVLEGKLKENNPSFYREDWCSAEDELELVQESSSQCIKRGHIERVETVFKEPRGAALLAVDDRWGKEESGYRVQIIPASAEYTVGQPVKVHLVMKNVSGRLKWYDVQGIGNAFLLKDPDGQPVLSRRAGVQTLGAEQAIDSGEIVVLADNKDIAEEFVITQPGNYTVQTASGVYGFTRETIPASNVLTLKINPGQAREEDLMIEAVAKFLPNQNWKASPGEGKSPYGPTGWLAADPVEIMIVGQGRTKQGIVIRLWQTDDPAILATDPDDKQASEYLGQAAGRHYYVLIPAETVTDWPYAREDIITALKIEQPSDSF